MHRQRDIIEIEILIRITSTFNRSKAEITKKKQNNLLGNCLHDFKTATINSSKTNIAKSSLIHHSIPSLNSKAIATTGILDSLTLPFN